eukprot:gene10665-2754_t
MEEEARAGEAAAARDAAVAELGAQRSLHAEAAAARLRDAAAHDAAQRAASEQRRLLQQRREEAEEEAASASSIGSKLSESVSMFVALLVMLTIVVVSLLNVEVIDGSTRAHVDSFSRMAGDSRAELQPVIDEYLEFYKSDIYMDPVSVKIGAELFEFKGLNFKISDKDLLKVE